MKKAGEDTTEILAEMRTLSDKVKALDTETRETEDALEKMLLMLRNAVVSRYRDIENDDEGIELRLTRTFTDREMMAMQEEIKTLLADADRNANDNLLLTRLSIGLMSCIEKQED